MFRCLLLALLGLSPLLLKPCASKTLTPPLFNVLEGKEITATSTCGDEEPEFYCRLLQKTNQSYANLFKAWHDMEENYKDVNSKKINTLCNFCHYQNNGHSPEHAIDGKKTWWQSPPLSRGMEYNKVNLTIDLAQAFYIVNIYIKMGISPRPKLWVLERSSDFGKTYYPWQYFAYSLSHCNTDFGELSHTIDKKNSAICNTQFTETEPLEGGEITISLLNIPPSPSTYPDPSALLDWTLATNIRFRFLETNTLYWHLIPIAEEDGVVTRQYFYAIEDIRIEARCNCYGHSESCDASGRCDCQHNTCGSQCEDCCPGFHQKAWKPSEECEPCNCFNHTSECHFDPVVDIMNSSLNIQGKYEGGGVCENCQHKTTGINCNECKRRFIRNDTLPLTHKNTCQRKKR